MQVLQASVFIFLKNKKQGTILKTNIQKKEQLCINTLIYSGLILCFNQPNLGTILKITTPANLFFAVKKNIHTFTKNFVTKKVVIWKTHSNSGQ